MSAQPGDARRPARIALLGLLLLATALRAYHLDFQSLWSDEGISLLRSSLPLGEMLRTMPVEHAPGYFVLLWAWLKVAGTTDFALRFLSLWPSVAAIAMAYRLAADMGSVRAGLVAALLLAVNPFQVWYAQEARMYSWLLAASLGATWLLWRLLAAPRARGQARAAHRAAAWPPIALAYAVLTALTIYLHHYGFLVPLAHTVFALAWLWWTRDFRRTAHWVAAGCGTLLLYLPWLPRLLGIFGFSGWRPLVNPWQLPWRYLTAYTVGDALPAPWHAWLPWLYAALALVGLWGWWRRNRGAAVLLAITFAVPLAAALALALRQPDFHERYTIFISAPLLVLVAGSALVGHPAARRAALPRIATAGLILAGLVAASGIALHRHYTDASLHKPDFRSAAERIARWEQPGDVILVDGPDPEKVFLHYYRGSAPVHDLRTLEGAGEEQVGMTLREATAGHARAWGLLYFHDPGPVQAWLAQRAWPTPATAHNGISLVLYGLGGEQAKAQPVGVAFGGELTLAESALSGAGSGKTLFARAGDLLEVTTAWQVHSAPPARKVSLRLLDGAGRLWAADDYVPRAGFAPMEGWPPGERATDARGLLLPPDLPPGPYRVTLRLYDPQNGAAVETPVGADVTLAAVDIAAALVAPDPAVLQIAERRDVSLGDGLAVIGIDVAPQPLRPGRAGELSVWWRVDQPPAQGSQVRIRLADGRGDPASEELHPLSPLPAHGSDWRPGQIVRERYQLTPDPLAATGRYRLELAFTGAPQTVAQVQIEARPRSYRLPKIAHPLDVRLGDAVVLRGYDLVSTEGSGEAVRLTLYWQATGRVGDHDKVFVHMLDETGAIVAQSDQVPAAGGAPTETWLPREVVMDEHTLQAPGSGRYRVLAGLYDPVTSQRMPAISAAGDPLPDNAIPIAEITLPVNR